MKRQCEELFFNYIANPKQNSENNIAFDLPDGYEPLPGDIIEMIISENQNMGFVSTYLRLVCYKPKNAAGTNIITYIAALAGKLPQVDNDLPLDLIDADIQEFDGKKYVVCFSAPGTKIDFQRTDLPNVVNFVNMIVNRSKGAIELYYL